MLLLGFYFYFHLYSKRLFLLFKLLPKIENDNAQSEYYLPDVLSMIVQNGGKIGIEKLNDIIEIQGINTNEQLLSLEREFKRRNQQ